MATKKLKNIFLSASVPLPERDPKYIDTADIIAIRDSIIALSTMVLPKYRLVWGGHPSITPIINYVLDKMDINIKDHVTLYQSKFFEKYYPKDNNKFKNVIQTADLDDREKSLLLMRETMFDSCEFSAGIFIGGMDGVEKEYKLFIKHQPKALVIPLASTGAAAKLIYDDINEKNERYEHDYAYMSVFQNYLLNKI